MAGQNDVLLDNDFTAEVYNQPDIIIPENIAGAGTAVTSINGVGGPAVTLGGGTTGMSFSVASPNITLTGTLVVANGGTGATTASGARTNLGLGTIATQDANNVAITGGSITGITDLALADGGTGSSTAAGARSNLGAAASGANNDINTFGALTGNTGWAAWTGTSDKTTHDTTTATLTNVAETLKALIDTLLTSGVIEV